MFRDTVKVFNFYNSRFNILFGGRITFASFATVAMIQKATIDIDQFGNMNMMREGDRRKQSDSCYI